MCSLIWDFCGEIGSWIGCLGFDFVVGRGRTSVAVVACAEYRPPQRKPRRKAKPNLPRVCFFLVIPVIPVAQISLVFLIYRLLLRYYIQGFSTLSGIVISGLVSLN